MLVLTRKIGEEIVIADEIRVKVIAVHGQRVRMGNTGPPSVKVARQELLAENSEAAPSFLNSRLGTGAASNR